IDLNSAFPSFTAAGSAAQAREIVRLESAIVQRVLMAFDAVGGVNPGARGGIRTRLAGHYPTDGQNIFACSFTDDFRVWCVTCADAPARTRGFPHAFTR